MFPDNLIGAGESSGTFDARSSRAFHDVLLFRAGADQARRRRGFWSGVLTSLAPLKDPSESFERGLSLGRVAIDGWLFLAGGIFGAGALLLASGGETQVRGGLVAALGLSIGCLVALLRVIARLWTRSAA